jgi:glycerol kinase
MDALRQFLEEVLRQGYAAGHFLGLLHLLIGRRITRSDGTEVSRGLTWRQVASYLKKVRWDKEVVRELGIDPAQLPPRDRQRYWYTAITLARVDSPEATAAGDQLAAILSTKGFTISSAPGT